MQPFFTHGVIHIYYINLIVIKLIKAIRKYIFYWTDYVKCDIMLSTNKAMSLLCRFSAQYNNLGLFLIDRTCKNKERIND